MISFTLGILASFLIGDLLHRYGASAEISRKFVHVATCLMIAAFPLFGIGYRELMLIVAGSFIAIAALRNTVLLRAIMAVERKSYGDLMLPLSVLVIAAANFAYPAMLGAYLVLGISDALASLIGRAYGRRRYTTFGHAKSYVGSAAFFLSAWAILMSTALYAGLSPVAALSTGLGVAAVLTLVEACSHQGVDNLFVPVVAAIGLHVLLPG